MVAPSTTFNVKCPHCETQHGCRDALIGKVCKCPHCGQAFRVPDRLPHDVKTSQPPVEPADPAVMPSRGIPARQWPYMRNAVLVVSGVVIGVLFFSVCVAILVFEEAEPSASNPPRDIATGSPFEYQVIGRAESDAGLYRFISIELETTNEVAKQAGEDDLRKLYEHLAPTLGDSKVHVRVYTPVPGAGPWGVIGRRKGDNGEWRFDFMLFEDGIDAEPYHFVNEIDRTVSNQRHMIVTLPCVNRIQEQLTRQGWGVEERREDIFSAKLRRRIESSSVMLDPDSVYIQTLFDTGNTFIDTVVIVFSEFGIDDDVRAKLHTVIGSPEYLRTAHGDPAEWTWKVGDLEINYRRSHLNDTLSASWASDE